MTEPWWQKGVQMFARLSTWIVAPVLMGVLAGKWLDKKFSSEPWLFIASVGLSFFVSMFGLIRETNREFKALNKPTENLNQATKESKELNDKQD